MIYEIGLHVFSRLYDKMLLSVGLSTCYRLADGAQRQEC